MNSCWRRDSARPSAVGEILRPHRQGQVHVVLQRAHQIGIAAGGEQRDVKGVVGLVDAAQVLRRRPWRNSAAAARSTARSGLRARAGRSSAPPAASASPAPRRSAAPPRWNRTARWRRYSSRAARCPGAPAGTAPGRTIMPAGAVARHQRVLDQPRARREAAEDDVLLQPADHIGLLFLARER